MAKEKTNALALLNDGMKSVMADPHHGLMVNVNSFMTLVRNQFRTNENLQKCHPYSVLNAALQAGRIGLIPDGVTGLAYLVPYGEECQLIIGYRGQLELCRRHVQGLSSIETECVYEGDEFKFRLGENANIKHTPNIEDPERESKPITHIYAIARMKDGSIYRKVMTRGAVEAYRDKYAKGVGRKDKRGNWTSPWKTNFEWMAKKTVIRQLLKLAPVSIEMQTVGTAFDAEQESFVGRSDRIYTSTNEITETFEPPPQDTSPGGVANAALEALESGSATETVAEAPAAPPAAEPPKEEKPRRRGRPKGSKNKPKETEQKPADNPAPSQQPAAAPATEEQPETAPAQQFDHSGKPSNEPPPTEEEKKIESKMFLDATRANYEACSTPEELKRSHGIAIDEARKDQLYLKDVGPRLEEMFRAVWNEKDFPPF